MIDQLISSSGFWFALGILAGLIVDLFARFGYEWWHRPILTSPQSDEDWLRPFHIKIADYRSEPWIFQGEEKEISVWRLKIENAGRRAAENVRGTFVSLPVDGDGAERRIAWYEPPRISLNLNSKDHSYLDLIGIPIGDENEVCLPTESGWGDTVKGYPANKLPRFNIRITASNCSPLLLEFDLDFSRSRKPILRNATIETEKSFAWRRKNIIPSARPRILIVLGAVFLVTGLFAALISNHYTTQIQGKRRMGIIVFGPEQGTQEWTATERRLKWADGFFYGGLFFTGVGILLQTVGGIRSLQTGTPRKESG
jgi:hypothetical protein